MPSRVLSMRSRVSVLVAVPLVLIMGLAVLALVHHAGDASRAGWRERQATAAGQAATLASSLQAESGRAVQWISDPSDERRAALDAARTATDTAVPGYRAAVDELDGESRQRFGAADAGIATLAELRQATDTPTGTDAVLDGYSALLGELDGAHRALLEDLAQHASSDASGASTARILAILLAIAGAVGLAVALRLVDAWVRRPIERLAAEVDEVAHSRLPIAISAAIEGTEAPDLYLVGDPECAELAPVAAAFNEAQRQVVALASDQVAIRRNVSDIFANLGRRNQKLIARQLSFIDRLEKREQDPEVLENLFRLDHLATRMRRNAESLLVLAGTETPRTWSAPVSVGDAVRAAVAEVENYERAEIRAMAPAKVRGNIASNVSHLLAELIENGLNFSPPDSAVVIDGEQAGSEYVISVIDRGIGIEADERDVLNVRLASSASLDVAPSRYLGLFVISRLAARYGIAVELLESDGGGTHARVTLPAEILVLDDAPASAGASGNGSAAGRVAGSSRNAAGMKPASLTGRSAPSTAVAPAQAAPVRDAAPATAATEGPARSSEPAGSAEPAGPAEPVRQASPAVSARPSGTAERNGNAERNGKAPTRDRAARQPSASAPPAANGTKLRSRPKRDTSANPSAAKTAAARPGAAKQKDRSTRSGGGRAHERTEEPEVMSSGLRRRAPKAALEQETRAHPAPPADGGGAEQAGNAPAARRSASEVQNMLSTFRAAQNRATQRPETTDSNDDEVTA